MDAETHIKPLTPDGREALRPWGTFAGGGVSELVEILKKTLCAAGLHWVGRDAAKDIPTHQIFTKRVGFAIAGALSLLGGDLENRHYANV